MAKPRTRPSSPLPAPSSGPPAPPETPCKPEVNCVESADALLAALRTADISEAQRRMEELGNLDENSKGPGAEYARLVRAAAWLALDPHNDRTPDSFHLPPS